MTIACSSGFGTGKAGLVREEKRARNTASSAGATAKKKKEVEKERGEVEVGDEGLRFGGMFFFRGDCVCVCVCIYM
jgi:hypothetical protein